MPLTVLVVQKIVQPSACTDWQRLLPLHFGKVQQLDQIFQWPAEGSGQPHIAHQFPEWKI